MHRRDGGHSVPECLSPARHVAAETRPWPLGERRRGLLSKSAGQLRSQAPKETPHLASHTFR